MFMMAFRSRKLRCLLIGITGLCFVVILACYTSLRELSIRIVLGRPKEKLFKVVTTSTNSSARFGSSDRIILTKDIYEDGFLSSAADLCPNMGEDIEVLIFVISAPMNNDSRMAIRYTWGNFRNRKDVSIGFLVGSVRDTHNQKLLDVEIKAYNDIIQSKTLDSYNNLTLKTISMLEWVHKHCDKANFILKADDDVFINVPRLLAFIRKHDNYKRSIFGKLKTNTTPIRNETSKYYASYKQYHRSYFPVFATGPAYLLTRDIVRDLYVTALNKIYLKLEDVFITGIVAEDLRIKRICVPEFFNTRISFREYNIWKGISIHQIKHIEQFDLWQKLSSRN